MRLSAVSRRGGAIRRVLGAAQVVPALQSLLGPDVELMLNRYTTSPCAAGTTARRCRSSCTVT